MSIRTGKMVTVMLLLSGAAGSAENTGGALGSTWADAAKMPDLFTGMWMTTAAMVEAKPELDVPYTAKAQKYVDSYKFKRDIPMPRKAVGRLVCPSPCVRGGSSSCTRPG